MRVSVWKDSQEAYIPDKKLDIDTRVNYIPG